MEITLEAIISFIGLFVGGGAGAFFTWRYQKKKAKAEAETAEIDAAKEMQGLTQEQLADKAGIQRTHLGRIEGGKYAVTLETIQAIAEALGMTVDIIDPKLADLAPLKTLT